jgi:cation diffusion facilitator CzcD-associated flavoprotein CzcO
MADGTRYKLDVIVYATGFDTHCYMRPMTVTGLNGVTIDQVWKDDIYSYRGVGLPGFPNMFLLYGPFAPLNNVPVPVGLEHEIGYIMKAIELARVGCKNWYIDTKGTPILWPLTQDEHEKLLAQLDEKDLELTEGRRA